MNTDTTNMGRVDQTVSFSDLAAETLRSLIHDLSFREYIATVRRGLDAPPDSGEYRYAKQQVLRLWAPVTGVMVPLVGMIVLLLIPQRAAPPMREIFIVLPDPPKMEDITPVPVKTEEKPKVEYTTFVDDAPSPFARTGPLDDSPAGQQGPGESLSTMVGPGDPLRNPVAFVPSLLKTRTVYTGRSKEGRGKGLGRYSDGLGGMTEDAVTKALRWLKKNQSSDGSWPQTKPAMTGFALLAFLAHDEKTDSAEFGYTVEKAIQFLISAQQPDGHFAGRDEHDYTHPIATYALCEAYGMTKLPQIKNAAQKALQCVVQGQHANGGFNYNLNAENRDDTSYMAWCAQAMKAGDIAYVMDEPEKLKAAMHKAIDGFKKNYRACGGDSAYAQGGFGYTSPDVSGLTSAGALCMQLLGAAAEKEVKSSIETMKGWTFEWNAATHGGTIYYAYYSTQVKFRDGGPAWTAWNKQFAPALCRNQTVIPKAIEGPASNRVDIGYWDSTASGHSDGGEGKRVMTTCLCTLMLEVYYRYLPTFQPEAVPGEAGGGDGKAREVRIDTKGI